MSSINLHVYRSEQLLDSYDLESPVIVGRRDLLQNDPAPIAVQRLSSSTTDELALPKNRISDIEATLVEVLASSVAAGIARQAEESLRNTLAGFFSPKVVKLLADNPELMDGHDSEVSVLFCDIRGFSSVTEKLGPGKAIQWINDVMSELS